MQVLEAWKKMGIVAVFAAGNSGDNCTTVVSPADLADAIAVGGTDRYDYLAGWSSKGPPLKPGGDFGRQKPEVCTHVGCDQKRDHCVVLNVSELTEPAEKPEQMISSDSTCLSIAPCRLPTADFKSATDRGTRSKYRERKQHQGRWLQCG